MAENTTIKMDADAVGDSAATIDVPDDGAIMSASLIIAGDQMDALGDNLAAELSFASTSSFPNNDIRTIICQGFVRTGDIQTAENGGQSAMFFREEFPDGIRVFAGERIHLHVIAGGGAVFGEVRALLVFKFRKFTPRRR